MAHHGTPLRATIEVGGPEEFRLDEFIRQGLRARHDPREIIGDATARYFGAHLAERALVAGSGARLGAIRFADWLREPANVM